MPPTMTPRAKGVTNPPANELPMPKSQPKRMVVFCRARFAASISCADSGVTVAGLVDGTEVVVIKIGVPFVA